LREPGRPSDEPTVVPGSMNRQQDGGREGPGRERGRGGTRKAKAKSSARCALGHAPRIRAGLASREVRWNARRLTTTRPCPCQMIRGAEDGDLAAGACATGRGVQRRRRAEPERATILPSPGSPLPLTSVSVKFWSKARLSPCVKSVGSAETVDTSAAPARQAASARSERILSKKREKRGEGRGRAA
jgi:hypothetical protein